SAAPGITTRTRRRHAKRTSSAFPASLWLPIRRRRLIANVGRVRWVLSVPSLTPLVVVSGRTVFPDRLKRSPVRRRTTERAAVSLFPIARPARGTTTITWGRRAFLTRIARWDSTSCPTAQPRRIDDARLAGQSLSRAVATRRLARPGALVAQGNTSCSVDQRAPTEHALVVRAAASIPTTTPSVVRSGVV